MINRFLTLTILLATLGLATSCEWIDARKVDSFEQNWTPLRDSVVLYCDSIQYLPRQATTYLDMMTQDTLFFRLFQPKEVERFALVRGLVEKARDELYANEGKYKSFLRRTEHTDLQFEQLKRYYLGRAAVKPPVTIGSLNDRADSLRIDLHRLKADHARLFAAIRTNFFMHKDLHNNLMKPFWDEAAKANPTEPITKVPAPRL